MYAQMCDDIILSNVPVTHSRLGLRRCVIRAKIAAPVYPQYSPSLGPPCMGLVGGLAARGGLSRPTAEQHRSFDPAQNCRGPSYVIPKLLAGKWPHTES